MNLSVSSLPSLEVDILCLWSDASVCMLQLNIFVFNISKKNVFSFIFPGIAHRTPIIAVLRQKYLPSSLRAKFAKYLTILSLSFVMLQHIQVEHL